jgi:hypothetical protein
MKILSTRSIDPTISSGAIAQKDLQKDGYISVIFYADDKRIFVDIAGIAVYHSYYFHPKNENVVSKNQYFVSKFVDKCIDPQDIKHNLGIK